MMSRARDRMQLTQGLRVFHYRRVDEITSGIVRAAHRSMYIPLVITVLAAALRLFRLDARSFWLDEIFTARITHLRSFADLQATLRTEPDQMPMYYLLTWLLRGMGGSEVVVRMPSVIAGTLSVVVIYLLGRQLFRPRVGWVAGLLMACLPFAVWYGQEARGYALLILFSALQILAAFHVVTRGCARYWALLAVATVFALYTHYVALAATATIAFYITLSGVVSLRGYSLMRQFLYALLTWLVVVVAYAPWLANLQSFLGNAGLGFGRARGASGLNWSQLQVWLASLDLHSILLALFLIGSASAAFKLFAGPWRAGSRLVLFCMAVPVAAFAVRSHGDVTAITPRYFAFVYPEVVLAISLGIEFSLCQLALRLRIRKSIAFVAVLTLVLLQITPSLAASYAHPKDDYRGVARFIAGANPAHSVVLGLGGGADFAALGLSYYFRRDGAPVTVLSGANVDARTAQQLATPGGQVWGIVFVADGRPYFTHPLPRGFSTLNFTGLTLIRTNVSHLTSLAAAQELLHWGAQFDPQVQASADLLHVLGSHSRLGPNLLSPVLSATTVAHDGRWWLTPGSRISADGRGFELTPSGTTNVVQSTARVTTGRTYLVSFTYRNVDLHGEQHVFVVAAGPQRQSLAVYPSGAGYLCSPGRNWTRALFALRGPSGVSRVSLWLRATGTGSASVRDIEIRGLQ